VKSGHEATKYFRKRSDHDVGFCWRRDLSRGRRTDCNGYVVQSGEVELKVRGKSLEVVGPDGFFGEMALIDQSGRRATAVAKTDCTIIPISEKHFLFMVEEAPFFALTVVRTMTARWRRMDMFKQ
jgi:CRP-like cAMP-binding protein